MALGLLGDKYGRRPIIMAAVALFGIATLATAAASHVDQILVLRFGPNRHRGPIMTVVLLGLPAGAIIGAMLAAGLDRRSLAGRVFMPWVALPLCCYWLYWCSPCPNPCIFLPSRPALDTSAVSNTRCRKSPRRPRCPGPITSSLKALRRRRSVRCFHQGLARNTLGVWVIYLFNWIA
ncbi:MAG: hypothetical protein PW845_06055 [Pseudomonas sp.]|nr:hypothetical protein [Pseudomonas sp.]